MSRTLFFDADTRAAVLVASRNGKRTQRIMRYRTAQAALAWCEREACAFVYTPTRQANLDFTS
jgi:hypothetical protein